MVDPGRRSQKSVALQPHPVGEVVDRGLGHVVDRQHPVEQRQGRLELRGNDLVGTELPQFVDLGDVFAPHQDPHGRRELACHPHAAAGAGRVGDGEHEAPRPGDARMLEHCGPRTVAVVDVEPQGPLAADGDGIELQHDVRHAELREGGGEVPTVEAEAGDDHVI